MYYYHIIIIIISIITTVTINTTMFTIICFHVITYYSRCADYTQRSTRDRFPDPGSFYRWPVSLSLSLSLSLYMYIYIYIYVCICVNEHMVNKYICYHRLSSMRSSGIPLIPSMGRDILYTAASWKPSPRLPLCCN